MKTSLVLTCIGPDRHGLVEALARAVAEHDGNWVESRMARLAGKFAGVLRVDLPEERAADLTKALEGLSGAGLRVTVEPSREEESRAPSRLVQLALVGRDRPGIVRDVSRVLAARGVNVEELETECTSAPESGEPLFQANATLHVPEALSTDDLRTALEEIANDLMVDVVLEDAAKGR
ncbi:MAG: ACT domain-containing protein [Deltaproteobacteria bacterium]|nr:ACT domain-containing protein [Deltaproteobacteria bacterium]